MRQILIFAVLLSSSCLRATESCSLRQIRTLVIEDADKATSDLVLFRGEVRSLPTRPTGWVWRPPVVYVDYGVEEILWGSLANPTVHTPYASLYPCGMPPQLTMNMNVFVLCWASQTDCGSPVAATDENSKKIRDWVWRAKLRQRKVSVSPEQAEVRVIHRVEPRYSELAKLARTQGDCVLQIVINARGRVVDARPLSGPRLLTYDAIQAVLQWRYNPFFLNGTPVKAETSVTVHFRL